jgi:hypothetical protein
MLGAKEMGFNCSVTLLELEYNNSNSFLEKPKKVLA